MKWLHELKRRLQVRWRREQFNDDLAEEMRLHLELRAADKQARGMTARDAQAAARRQFGNVAQIQETSREAWGWRFLDTIRQDVRYGLRTLAGNRGFALTAILSLALGIGANTAVFSILNAVMLRTLPVEDPSTLVQLKLGDNAIFSNPIWEQVRDHQQALAGAAAFANERLDLADGGESHFIQGLWVSGDYFRVVGVPAIKGRTLTVSDDERGDPPVAVISHNFWQRHFNADPGIIGKSVRLNRMPFEIVGIAAPWFTGFDLDQRFDVVLPLACHPLLHSERNSLDQRSSWWLRVLARLKPNTTIAVARERMNMIALEVFKATLPENWRAEEQARHLENRFAITPASTGYSAAGNRYQTALYTLMAIVSLVLLIACANIANLLLARATVRQREFSMRMAIGAGRRRLVRQLLTESLILALLGSTTGFLLAQWGSRVMIRLLSTTRYPLDLDLSPDLRVLAFTIGAACFTALLFGLAPAFRATRGGLNRVLKENSRGAVQGFTRFHLGKALVAGQIALSLLLLIGAALFLGSLRNLLAVDLGVKPEQVLFINTNTERAGIAREQRTQVSREIVEQLRRVPGIVSAGTVDVPPLIGFMWNNLLSPEGSAPLSRQDASTYMNSVSPGYFDAIGTPLLLGRDFTPQDGLNSPKVMVIGEKTARDFFGDQSPIGKRIVQQEPRNRTEYEVIGVVKDIKYVTVDEPQRRTAYIAAAQIEEPRPQISYAVRVAGVPEAVIPAAREVIEKMYSGISLEFRTFEVQLAESLQQPRIVALLSGIFGALALLLAMIGIYGITAYGVAGRQGEIGIRMALGAQGRAVVWLVLRDVLALLVAGIALGLLASLSISGLVMSLLFGVQPNEPLHLVLAVTVLAAATMLAAYIPARRAARLDPITALREE